MNKKKTDIVFIVLREQFPGHKDIDHLLPFLYFINKSNSFNLNASVLIIENQSNYKKNLDQRVKLLFNLKNIDVKFLYKNNFIYKLKNIFETKYNFFILNKFFKFFYLKYLEAKINKCNFKDLLGDFFLKSKCPLIITLHNNDKVQKIISKIQKLNRKSKWVVIPHGTQTQVNKMLTIKDLNKVQKKNKKNIYNKIDFYLNTSKSDLIDQLESGMSKKKGIIIGSPRYCKEWLYTKSRLRLDGKKVNINKNYSVKVLFFLPKKFINIFWDELIRTVDFVSSYKKIEVILLDYDPNFSKFPNYLRKRKNIRFFSISKEYSTSKLIEWSDIIFHVASSVLFECLMKDKITVFPKYLTCNTSFCEKYDVGFNLNNRDELRILCNQAVKSLNNLKFKYKKKCKKNNKKYIDDFVNANSKSVPYNVVNTMTQIIKSF
tara:strand:- start:31981 stop:33276 length:1296 start_codon:yes stop_codon:yes gene_type:complete